MKEAMGKRLFVGNLSYNVGDQDLRTEFEKCGKVQDAKVVMDRDTGRSRGFGFVEFTSETDAAGAISTLDGSVFGGRNLVVKVAEERRPGGGGGGGFRRPPAPSGDAPRYNSAPSPQYGQGNRDAGGGGGGRGKGPRKKGGSRRRRDDDFDWGG